MSRTAPDPAVLADAHVTAHALQPPSLRRLSFPPGIEEIFLRDQTRAYLTVLRICVSFIVLVYFLYLGFDYWQFGRYRHSGAHAVILGIAAPAALLGILATFHPHSDRFIRAGVLAATVINGLALVATYYLTLLNGAPIPYECIIVYIYYCYFQLGIGSFHAFLIAIATWALHLLTLYMADVQSALIYDHGFMMIIGVLVGAMSSRLLERSSRINWLNERRLRELAERDALTGVLNQHTFFERANAALARARIPNRDMALIMITLEHLPLYNHLLSHPAVDECLRQVGDCLRGQVRGHGDLVGRLGGEQFLVLLHDCNAENARRAGERFRAAVSERSIAHPGSPHGRAHLLFGCAAAPAVDFASAETAAQRANEALLRARNPQFYRSAVHESPA